MKVEFSLFHSKEMWTFKLHDLIAGSVVKRADGWTFTGSYKRYATLEEAALAMLKRRASQMRKEIVRIRKRIANAA